jgi:sigma54-dependent transcription regulator
VPSTRWRRGAGPFVAVNCGAIPEHLLEAEFFGYRKGAFTGAAEDREGFFQAASGGTLFLDEIGDLPLAMQSKLLRAIQERRCARWVRSAEVPVNVRLVSATHKDLAAEVAAGRFRQDLVLPPQRHPDPRAALAGAPGGPARHLQRAVGAHRGRWDWRVRLRRSVARTCRPIWPPTSTTPSAACWSVRWRSAAATVRRPASASG